MGLSLRGTTSGAVDINAPAVAGDNTITLPGNNGAANQFYKNSGTAGIVTHSSMIEDSSGNVGIGSIIPQDELDVHGNIITGGLKVVNNDRGNPTRKIVIGSSSVYYIRLYDPNDTTKIQSVFKVDGTVGIGTDNPESNAQATIYKTGGNTPLYLKTDNTNSYLYFQDSGTTTFKCAVGSSSNQLKFVTDGSERLRIDSSGRLFVGGTVATPTTTSADDIVIAGSGNIGLTINSTNSAESSIFFADGTSGSSQYMGQVNYYHSVDALTFASAGSERMRIDSSGRVMIQNTAASSLNAAADDLVVGSGSASGGITVYTGSSDQGALYFADGTNGTEPYVGGINYGHSDNQLRFLSNGSTYMRLDSSGRLLLGTATSPTAGNGQYANIVVQGYPSTPTGAGHISLQRGQAAFGANNQIGLINFGDNTGASYAGIECYADADSGANDYPGRLVFSTTADSASSPVERYRIAATGKHTFTLPDQTEQNLQINKNQAAKITTTYANLLANTSLVFQNYDLTESQGTGSLIKWQQLGQSSNAHSAYFGAMTTSSTAGDNEFIWIQQYTSGNTNRVTMRLNDTGNLTVTGSISKGSGSFKIDHPLPVKKDTHHLVHSFIEGPQADLIYRGQVTLVDGTATVNIDTAARMTEGTFVLLNTNVSCFTSNETDWTPVRGSVSGNVLTIEAQDNTSAATVSWMVVGERQDQHMIDTDWTDENGRIITEPLKSE